MQTETTHKLCVKCRESKPFSEFHKSRTSGDGYKSVCMECNPNYLEKLRESDKSYRLKNKEKIAKAKKKYYKEHRAEKLSYGRDYYQKNKKPKIEKTEKYCPHCHTTKDISEFYIERDLLGNFLGYLSYCKSCRQHKYKVYYEANKEEVSRKKAQYHRDKKKVVATEKTCSISSLWS